MIETAPGRRRGGSFRWESAIPPVFLIVGLLFAVPAMGAVVVNVRDEFGFVSFSNNDGPDNWTAGWVENDPTSGGAGPAAGNVRVASDALRLDDEPDTGGAPSAAREVDLSGGTVGQVTFSFDFSTSSDVDSSDAVIVEVSSNGGGSYTTLETITGIVGVTVESRSFDITSFKSSQTRVRFRIANNYGGANEFFFADNVDVTADDAPPTVPGRGPWSMTLLASLFALGLLIAVLRLRTTSG